MEDRHDCDLQFGPNLGLEYKCIMHSVRDGVVWHIDQFDNQWVVSE